MPKFWCSRLRSDFVRSPALTSNTSESAAWKIISAFCGKDARSRVERFAPRSASAGSEWDVIHAGTMPNTIPVTSESRNAKPRIGGEGLACIGRLRRVGECQRQYGARSRVGHKKTG